MTGDLGKAKEYHDSPLTRYRLLLPAAAVLFLVVLLLIYWQKSIIPSKIERLSILNEEAARCNFEYKDMLDKYLQIEEEFRYEVEIITAYADEQAKTHEKFKRNARKLYERYEELFAAKKQQKEAFSKKYREIILEYNRTQKTYEQWKKERLDYLLDDETSYDIRRSGKRVNELKELTADGNQQLRVRIAELKNDHSVLKELEKETDKVLAEHKKYAKTAKDAFEEFSRLENKAQGKQEFYKVKLEDYRGELEAKKDVLDALENEMKKIRSFPGVDSRYEQ